MKIILISDSEELVAQVESLKSASDQLQVYQREHTSLRLDRLDIASTDIIVIDSEELIDDDARAISSIVHSLSACPDIVYLCKTSNQSQLVELIRAGASDVIHKPFHDRELTDSIERIRVKRYNTNRNQSKVLSFMSCKGGAGATFLATNLGYILATESQKKILYIDLHMQGGDAAFYLTNLTGSSTIADIAKHSDLDSMMITSATVQIEDKYLLLQAPDTPEKATGLNASHIDNLISVAIQDYDFVIIDLPHILDGLTIKALDRSDLIFVVTQPIMTYMKAVTHILHLLTRLEYDSAKVRVLLNRMDNVGVLSVSRVEESIQKNIAASIPNDFMNSVEAVNMGVPIVKAASDSPISNALRTMALELTGVSMPAPVKTSFLQKILRK